MCSLRSFFAAWWLALPCIAAGEATPVSSAELHSVADLDKAEFYAAIVARTPRLEGATVSCDELIPILQRFAEDSHSWDPPQSQSADVQPVAIPGLEPIPAAEEAESPDQAKDEIKKTNYWETFCAWFQTACGIAEDDDTAKLTELFLAASPAPDHTREMFLSLAGLCIRRELARISEKAPILLHVLSDLAAEWKDSHNRSFRHGQSAPTPAPEVLEAWQYARGVAAPALAALDDVDPKLRRRGYDNDEARFIAIRREALTTPSRDTAIDAALLWWGGGCMTGDGNREPQQAVIALLSWLKLDCFREAAAMALQIGSGRERDLDVAFTNATAAVACLQALGVDAEKALVGGMAGRLPDWSKLRNLVSRDFDFAFQYSFQRCATTYSVELLTKIASSLLPEERRYIVDLLASFIEPGEFAPDAFKRAYANSRKVDAPAQETALASIYGLLAMELPEEPLQRTIDLVRNLGRAEGRAPLRPLLEHWSEKVRVHTANALLALGEEPRELAPREPVRFIISTNGVPFADAAVHVEVKSDEWSGNTEGKTDATGLLTLARDIFARPSWSARTVRCYLYNFNAKTELVPGRGAVVNPWWSTTMPMPANLETPIPIPIQTGKLVITVAYPRGRELEQGLSVQLRKLDSPANDYVSDWGEFRVHSERRIEFVALSCGDYEVELSGRGVSTWRVPRVRIGPGQALLNAQIKSGADVQAGFGQIGDGPEWVPVVFDLEQNGKPLGRFDASASGVLPGLPVGRYKMIVLSSGEADEYRRKTLPYYERDGDAQTWGRTNAEFIVSEKSPAFLNLPAVRLLPAGKAAAK